MSEKKVSVILPVYNTKEYLDTCFSSLINQTLKEIEIIVIDDGSTDGSLEVLKEYENKYDNIHLISVSNGGQGRARNIGIKQAKGEYIGFCDSDDYFEQNGLELMYEKAKAKDFDLLISPEYRNRKENQYILGEIPQPVDKSTLIRNLNLISFPSLLVKRELFEKAGSIPEIVFEDVAYIPGLISKCENLGYHTVPVYHYVERSTSTLFQTKEEKILDLLKAVDYAKSHVEREFQDEITMAMANKLTEKVRTLWYFSDVVLEHLRTWKSEIENNPIYLENPKKYSQMTGFLNLPQQPFEKVLYTNGFEKKSRQFSTAGFRQGGEVIYLSEENCDIGCCKKAEILFQAKKFQELSAYFAMKKILETSGVYVSDKMEITGVFDGIRYFRAFYCYESEENFTSNVFGGQKQQREMKKILELFEQDMEMTMAEAIRQALVECYDVVPDGKNKYTKYPVLLLSPLASIANAGGRITLTKQVDFEEEEDSKKSLVTMPQDTLETIYNFPTGWQNAQINNEKYHVSDLRRKLRNQTEKAEYLKGRVEQKESILLEEKAKVKELKTSLAYKGGSAMLESKIGTLILRLFLKLESKKKKSYS